MSGLFLGLESLQAGRRGVARVARLVARVAVTVCPEVRAALFADPAPDGGFPMRQAACGGSKLRFARETHAAAVRRFHGFYDILSMARAHPRLPGLRRPFMCFLHGVEIWERAAPAKVAAARRASLLVANSRHTAERARACWKDLPEVRTCWLATETDEAPAPGVRRRPRVLIVGAMDLDGYKGHAELIEAWPRVVDAVPEAVLTIAGGGPAEDELKRRARGHGSIEFLGRVEESVLDRLYSEASCFAMPSRGEGFGLVYIEAMRHGLPIIASIHDAAAEINADGETGFNVDLDSQGQLEERLIGILRNETLAGSLGACARDRWRRNFTYSCFRERFAPILKGFMEDLS